MMTENTKTSKQAAPKRQVCLVLIMCDSIPKKVLTTLSRQENLVNWETFLLEAAIAMGEGFLLKALLENRRRTMLVENPQAEEENHEPVEIETGSKPRLYTISAAGKVSQSRFSFARAIKYYPSLRLRGTWLEKHGFQIGEKYLVHPSKDQLILRTGKAMDEELGITKTGKNNA